MLKVLKERPLRIPYPSASVQYLPFYGGARGKYLEIKKDNTGRTTSEKIVSEENINSENIIKAGNGAPLAKVMANYLQNLKTLSSSLLRLTNTGRKNGYLGDRQKTRYETQLASLGEIATNITDLIYEIGDVNKIFKKDTTLRKIDNEDDDYIGEEGVGLESNDDTSDIGLLEHETIAEAKPVGLALIGETGVASSKPVATAIAAHGAAIASPVASAIAGVDPAALGISFQLHHPFSKH
ncbi:unnamed protein product [Arctia plantaginis]|uniref:DUF4774 domain-containing protein n=1 Tax=Arctia plantaginis TaxID=874455 RepID=A0A8S0Z571_ARCPL|nr:unnamed protein product [Arctia plantaginis]